MEFKGTMIMTGAAGGLGVAFAQEFTRVQDDHFGAIFTIREFGTPRVDQLQKIIRDDKRCQIRSLKLHNLQCVREFAIEINIQVSSGELAPITALCLNAGYMSGHGQSFTDDGYEKAFQINYLSSFLLAHLLLPSFDRARGRIVFVTSFSHDPRSKHARRLGLPKQLFRPAEVIARPPPDTGNQHRAGFRRYAESKMCTMMLMHSLQHRLNSNEKLAGIMVLAVDPGVVASTDIMREQHFLNRLVVEGILGFLTPLLQKLFRNGLLRTQKRSAKDILNACMGDNGPTACKEAKAMVANGSKLQASSLESRDVAKQDLLWKGSLKLVQLSEDERVILRDVPP